MTYIKLNRYCFSMLGYTTFIKYNFNSFTTMLRFALLNIELHGGTKSVNKFIRILLLDHFI